MSSQLNIQSDFRETFAIHIALKSALKAKKFSKLASVHKAADTLCKDLGSERSVYGRQLKMIGMLEKGATMADLHKKLKCSRRTIYRYLNEFEDAGLDIKLANEKYSVDKTVSQMLRA